MRSPTVGTQRMRKCSAGPATTALIVFLSQGPQASVALGYDLEIFIIGMRLN